MATLHNLEHVSAIDIEPLLLTPKNSPDQVQALPSGLMPPSLPAHQCRRIDAQLPGHLPLREAKRPARGSKAFRERAGRGQGVVSQELNDGRHIADLGDGCVAFPAGNGLFVNPDLVGNLLLEELKVESPRAEMIP